MVFVNVNIGHMKADRAHQYCKAIVDHYNEMKKEDDPEIIVFSVRSDGTGGVSIANPSDCAFTIDIDGTPIEMTYEDVAKALLGRINEIFNEVITEEVTEISEESPDEEDIILNGFSEINS